MLEFPTKLEIFLSKEFDPVFMIVIYYVIFIDIILIYFLTASFIYQNFFQHNLS